MRKPTSPRFVTICIHGDTARQQRSNARRFEFLGTVAHEINERWEKIDAIVLPGGFLRNGETIGSYSYTDRVKKLAAVGLIEPVTSAVRKLVRSPNALIVAGIDGPAKEQEQMSVAWDKKGIAGIGRKVFPVGGEPGESEAEMMLCYEPDYGDKYRVVTLASGHKAILCACYDLFGVSDVYKKYGKRARSIVRIISRGKEYNKTTDSRRLFWPVLQRCIEQWYGLLKSSNVTVAITNIHRFENQATGYWQKHAIASSSAALNGGYAVCAAHFVKKLPASDKSSPLAAMNVPKAQLKMGLQRKSYSWQSADSFRADVAGIKILVRQFSVDSSIYKN